MSCLYNLRRVLNNRFVCGTCKVSIFRRYLSILQDVIAGTASQSNKYSNTYSTYIKLSNKPYIYLFTNKYI